MSIVSVYKYGFSTHIWCVCRSVEENCKYRIEFSEADMRGGMKKLRHFAATFPCTLDCVEFRDISSSLSPLEFRIVLEKLTSVRFSDAEVRRGSAVQCSSCDVQELRTSATQYDCVHVFFSNRLQLF